MSFSKFAFCFWTHLECDSPRCDTRVKIDGPRDGGLFEESSLASPLSAQWVDYCDSDCTEKPRWDGESRVLPKSPKACNEC
jgi:hypothetical protein